MFCLTAFMKMVIPRRWKGRGKAEHQESLSTEAPEDPRLLDQITEHWVMSEIDNKRFLPQKCFRLIFSDGNVRDALPGASQALLRFITEEATKTFATVLRATRKSGRELVEIMDSFLEKGLNDARLADGDEPQCTFARHSNCMHHDAFNVLHNTRLWDITAVQDFFDARWIFLAPVFSPSRFGDNLAPRAILPFDWIETDCSKNPIGGFSRVQQARIHPDHHGMSSENGSGLIVAIKELQPSQDMDYPDPETAWKHELNALNGTSRHNHKHLTSAIAAFQRNKRYYLVFEWANGGSLEHFWERVPDPPLGSELVHDVLEQLHGLADALVCLHGLRGDESKATNSNGNNSSGESKTMESGHWRHGDLKPENILRFKSSNEPVRLGTLQIADLGLARRHTQATRDRIVPTSMRYGTVKYESPEGHPTNAMSRPRSRLYDVWSMGCIVLELVIWLLYGYEGLLRFREQTLDPSLMGEGVQQGFNGTNFYNVTNGKFEVNNVAKYWMQAIQENDPEFTNGKKTALSDLLGIVKRKLLVVRSDEKEGIGEDESSHESGTPMTGCRASASELKEGLEEILNEGRKRKDYLFTETSRANVVPPSMHRVPSQHLAVPSGGMPTHLTPSQDSTPFKETRIAVPEYSHALTDTWLFIVDNDFAIEIFRINSDCLVSPHAIAEDLCRFCRGLDLSDSFFRLKANVDSLYTKSQQCGFCRLLYQACRSFDITGDITLYRDGSTLRIRGFEGPILSICRSFKISKPLDGIQIGFPALPQEDHGPRLNVIRQWLKHCNHHHACSPNTSTILPTRVIEVGTDDGSQQVRLWETHGCSGKYIALSHRWGNTDTHPPFSTKRSNIHDRMQSINVNDLPATFQDAVTVTRKLGIPYLWIDSICIIQGADGDWDAEAKCMEDVFSFAYCVIAATRASGTADGFLKPPSPRGFVTLSDGSGGCIYVCEAIDDFDQHVTKADLNRRGWVYQERALARRTIHFTKEQLYWECGDGVRCETLTKMRNKAALFGDPEFPKVARSQSKGGIIAFFEDFYRQYSRLALSVSTDRPVAIAGLEARLIRALGVHGGYGIIDSHETGHASYLGRSLLWMRGEGVASMTKIQFSPDTQVPSWSWMSNQGGIDYLDAPFNEVNWERDEIRSPWNQKLLQQSSWHTVDRAGGTKLTGIAREFEDSADDKIIYDRGSVPGGQDLKCVVIGRSKSGEDNDLKTYYVLIIGKTGNDQWERVGVAKLTGKNIAFSRGSTPVAIS